jgi:hypothetical protein
MFSNQKLSAQEAQSLVFTFMQNAFGGRAEQLKSVSIEPLVEADARKAALWLADNQDRGVDHLQPQVQKLIYEMFIHTLFLLSSMAKENPNQALPEKVSRTATDKEKLALLIRNLVARVPNSQLLSGQ